ncbi:MAG: dipeptide epimerase [Thermoanaerobacteraceae bacterium]|nr:dipeptide epimerase [Thermoanaerobacteraceae bacterium]
MKIKDVRVSRIKAPLKKPFKTALRTVDFVEDVLVYVETDDGYIGMGEAAPTAVITGDILGSIEDAVMSYIRPAILGIDVLDTDRVFLAMDRCILHNPSAKAAVDMAVYDILGKYYNVPLYRLLGGYTDRIRTDITISINEIDEMVEDSVRAVKEGFDTLKTKVGGDYRKDIERVKAIRDAVGPDVKIRLDANQGWRAKDAVRAINALERYDIELVEQPVPAWDVEGLAEVTRAVSVPVMADEALFTPNDAIRLISMRTCDILNIKLMKAGGIHNAIKINSMAEAAGIECMVGSMMECKVSVTAAAHFAASTHNVTRLDLDAAYLLAEDPVAGGIRYDGPDISFEAGPGLGIEGLKCC